ncbi:hypothetical protein Taro_029595 [Colocasia esculenta]|uniref:Peroxidase n=1 Tax=Colocasia esculenta TaxID=4460 RepID=A0A843VXN3_COLES|nr:hypothetical protein [Colocasia esculenta]
MRSIFFLAFLIPAVVGDLQVGFYNTSCPQAEDIVQSVVENHFSNDSSVPAALLRLHFHDCFVRGCDASILIDSKKKKSEKSAPPNLTVRGYDIIDEAKSNLEAQCPATVSCADIISLATRDAVALAGGPIYDVPTGRRDGLVSRNSDVNLPSPTFTVAQAAQAFAAKGFTLDEMVTLLGAHTVGVAHCNFFRDRLFNFNSTGAPDPTMDPQLRQRLAKVCGPKTKTLSKDHTVFLDQNTSFVFDNQFYNQILLNQGILQIDQELALDGASAATVSGFAANGDGFLQNFAEAIVKMGSIDVLVGNAGQIRLKCNQFN